MLLKSKNIFLFIIPSFSMIIINIKLHIHRHHFIYDRHEISIKVQTIFSLLFQRIIF
jgi:hypothetical protein